MCMLLNGPSLWHPRIMPVTQQLVQLDLGVHIVHLGAQVLGHPLGGGAAIDEGVNY